MRRAYLIRCSAAGIALAAFFILQALWIPAKATLGQALLEYSWQQLRVGNAGAKPWPWADTSAAGLLEVPRLGIRQVLLSGASPRNLAWGPVWYSTGNDRGMGDVVLSGHRDTHFRFLQDLQIGDSLILRSGAGHREYRVLGAQVVDSTKTGLLPAPDSGRLVLVTCYPFDALQAGGPLRYVITALPEA